MYGFGTLRGLQPHSPTTISKLSKICSPQTRGMYYQKNLPESHQIVSYDAVIILLSGVLGFAIKNDSPFTMISYMLLDFSNISVRKLYDVDVLVSDIRESEKHEDMLATDTLSSVFKNKDPCVQIFILKHLNIRNTVITRYIVNRLIRLYKHFLSKHPLSRDLDLGSLIKSTLLQNDCSQVPLEDMIRIMEGIKLNMDEISRIREIYGYNQIFKHFKAVYSDILSFKYGDRYLSVLIRLLDCPDIVYSKYLIIFKKIGNYHKSKYIERNIVVISHYIVALLDCHPEYMSTKTSYLINIIRYIMGIVLDLNNYKFFTVKDTNSLVCLVEALAKVVVWKNAGRNYIFDEYLKLIKLVTTCENMNPFFLENIVHISNICKLCRTFAIELNSVGSTTLYSELIVSSVCKYRIEKSPYVDRNTWKHISSLFYSSKYALIDSLLAFEHVDVDTNVILDDIMCMQSNTITIYPNVLLLLSIEDITPIICDRKRNSAFFSYIVYQTLGESKIDQDIVFNYMKSLEVYGHYTLLSVVVHYLVDRKSLVTSYKRANILLLDLFFVCIQRDNMACEFMIDRIYDFFLGYSSIESLSDLMELLLCRLKDSKVYDLRIIVLIFILVKRLKNHMEHSMVDCCCMYFFKGLEGYKISECSDQNFFAGQSKLYLASICIFLLETDNDVCLADSENCKQVTVFHKLIVAIVCLIFRPKSNGEVATVKNALISYLFKCSISEREYLGSFYRLIDGDIRYSSRENNSLITMFHKLHQLYNRL